MRSYDMRPETLQADADWMAGHLAMDSLKWTDHTTPRTSQRLTFNYDYRMRNGRTVWFAYTLRLIRWQRSA